MRWLQSGGRGYRHKCLINTPEDGHTVSNLAYADDLAAMTNNIADMKVQAQKTELDINKFDAIRTRTCKRITGLPVSTSSAMAHQDTDQAGLGLPSLMVTFAEVIGVAIGVALTQPSNKQSLHQSLHYHLARQLATAAPGVSTDIFHHDMLTSQGMR